MDKIDRFQDGHRWLSNFWLVHIPFEGHIYASVEHAYVAAKTLDESEREHVRTLSNPGSVKRFGRKLTLRDDWEDVKLSVMEDLLRMKFRQERLRMLLLSTGEAELIEGNTWGDRFWGQDPQGNGHNHLGKLLMKLRAEYRVRVDVC